MPKNGEVITSTANRHIVEVGKLGQRKHRKRQGRFLVEGLQLIQMALDGGWQPDEAFFCPDQMVSERAPELLSRLAAQGARVSEVSSPVMDRLTTREVSGGMIATFGIREAKLPDSRAGRPELYVVLDRLQDMGNVGTLIRTADAVGARAVVLLEPCADPFDPKTVRATMGSLFNLPVVHATETASLFADLADRGIVSVAADVYQGTMWGKGLWDASVALVMGNEGRGLSDDVREHVSRWVRLPMLGKAESLNVAIAGGVLMYGWLRANIAALGESE